MFEPNWLFAILAYAATLFVVVVGLGMLGLIVVYVIDVTQTRHAVRRNYPVIGRLRYLFERLGEFFRQYFFAMDREELPFNRAERSWVYRAAKNVDSTVAFGSTRDLRATGAVLFVNCAFPVLGRDAAPSDRTVIGPYCRRPYATDALFNISGMSYGAVSRPAALALSRGAKLAGCWLNTGEGGLSPYHLEGGADLVFQIGTANYGVRNANGLLDDERLLELSAHQQIRMFELKLSQGAKPGKGGILPGKKVTPEIARIRGIPPRQDSISPNRHPEINRVEELLDVIERIRGLTGRPVGFKCVVGDYDWLEQMCDAVHERGLESAPDFITVDSADGGTGAAPMSLIDYMGLPIRESLPTVVDLLERRGLKGRIKIIASGKLVTPAGVAWALCVGADFVVSARGFMFALGCIQALQCNKNTCPTGITTHDPRLQRGLDPQGKSIRVCNYVNNMVREVGVIAHSCGVAHPRGLKRRHARIVVEDGRSVSMETYLAGPAAPP